MRTRSKLPWAALCLAACGHAPTPPAGASTGPSAQEPPPQLSEPEPAASEDVDPAPGALTEAQLAEIERLRSIGYADGTLEAGLEETRVGVIHFQPTRAYIGVNFCVAAHFPGAVLLDMEGHELFRWEKDFASVWPEDNVRANDPNTRYWRRAHLYENGDILGIFEGFGIFKLDRDSNLQWAVRNGAHHDLFVHGDGSIYVLTREAHMVPRVNAEMPILEDAITVLDPSGRELRRVSLLEAFENSEGHRSIWESSSIRKGDIFHTNSIEVLDDRIAGKAREFRAGRVLTSLLMLNTIAVVDLDTETVVWASQGEFKRQHDPKILDNGRLLLFDNEGSPGQSAVLEYDPISMKVVWAYRGSPEKPFFSKWCGAAQRLPNGNTLITETSPGRAFEVNREQEIVWEYQNPGRVGRDRSLVAKVLEMIRLGPDFPLSWISE